MNDEPRPGISVDGQELHVVERDLLGESRSVKTNKWKLLGEELTGMVLSGLGTLDALVQVMGEMLGVGELDRSYRSS